MNKKIEDFKKEFLSTDYPKWRNVVSCSFLLILSYGAVLTFGYMYFTAPELKCWNGFFYLSVVWLFVQTAVIGFLYFYSNIPAFARWSVTLLILVANMWFILFLFSLKSCV